MPPALFPSNPPQVIDWCGPLGGPSYVYRGVAIDADTQGTTYRITWPNTDLDDWMSSTDLERVCRLVDAWLDQHHPPEGSE
jgi:hypothetical protein